MEKPLKKRLRISLYLDEELKDFLPLFSEALNRRSLLGEFLKSMLIFINKVTCDPEKTSGIVRHVARGNFDILKSLFVENNRVDTSFDSDEEVPIDEFIL